MDNHGTGKDEAMDRDDKFVEVAEKKDLDTVGDGMTANEKAALTRRILLKLDFRYRSTTSHISSSCFSNKSNNTY